MSLHQDSTHSPARLRRFRSTPRVVPIQNDVGSSAFTPTNSMQAPRSPKYALIIHMGNNPNNNNNNEPQGSVVLGGRFTFIEGPGPATNLAPVIALPGLSPIDSEGPVPDAPGADGAANDGAV